MSKLTKFVVYSTDMDSGDVLCDIVVAADFDAAIRKVQAGKPYSTNHLLSTIEAEIEMLQRLAAMPDEDIEAEWQADVESDIRAEGGDECQ